MCRWHILGHVVVHFVAEDMICCIIHYTWSMVHMAVQSHLDNGSQGWSAYDLHSQEELGDERMEKVDSC